MSSYGKVELEVNPHRHRIERPEPETPFRIAILGDFAGRENRGVFDAALAARKPSRIDRDSFDDVMAKLAPSLNLPRAGTICFRSLDDFHPDALFRRVPVFKLLRDTRERLTDPATFRATAAELQRPAPAAPARFSLDDLVGETETPAPRRRDDLQDMLNEIVAPYLVPRPDPRQAEMVAQVDQAIGGEMRALLHDPAFQALEAAWRGLYFLVRRLETGTDLQIWLFDISRGELAADLLKAEELRPTGIYRLIVEKSVGTPEADRWAVLAGNYTFGPSLDDADLLGRLAMLGRAAGAPFLAAASSLLLGCASLAATPRSEDWDTKGECSHYWPRLRRIPEAEWAGLALPRLLLRLPYGPRTDAIEEFDFEEMPGVPEHGAYLWGNPAFGLACLTGQAFSAAGWNLRPGVPSDFSGLPAHVYEEDGETKLKPCAETLMTEETAETVLDRGLMLFASFKNTDRVRLMRFQSIADPPRPLAGAWA